MVDIDDGRVRMRARAYARRPVAAVSSFSFVIWSPVCPSVSPKTAIEELIEDKVLSEKFTADYVDRNPPKGEDTPISHANSVLKPHCMTLVSATHRFQEGCMAYNLLQIRKHCRLIIVVQLWDLKFPKMSCRHCVAWDGSIVHDRPFSVGVNNSSDRDNSANSRAVFERLFHRTVYSRWQITNVYELVRL